MDKEWFNEHVVSMTKTDDVEGAPLYMIRWCKPGTSVFYMEFIIHRGNLYVCGDLGCATYRWYGGDSTTHHPSFYGDLGLSYFKEKMEASEYGRGYEAEELNKEEVRRDLYQIRKDMAQEQRDFGGRLDQLRAYKEHRDDIIEAAHCGNKHEWIEWVKAHDDIMIDLFGYDWHSAMSGLGMVTPVRIVAHGTA